MEIRTADESGVTVMSVSGRLDSVTSGALETEVTNRIAAGQTRLVLDLTALDYISSAGLRVFLIAARTLRGKGALGLAAPRDGPAVAFRWTPTLSVEREVGYRRRRERRLSAMASLLDVLPRIGRFRPICRRRRPRGVRHGV